MWRLLVVGVLFLSCADTIGREQLFAVDFGTVELAHLHTASLRVQNTRLVPSRLLRIEQRDGARGFTIVPKYEPLAAGEDTTWTVHFDAYEPGLKSARFVAIFERGEAEVTLTARAAERCAVEPRVDFGSGPLGERTLTFQLTNPSQSSAKVFLGALTEPFSSELSGDIALAANETRDVAVHFSGTSEGAFQQTWRVQPRPDCAATEVMLLANVNHNR
ncbi:MAG: hypothetical protein ACO1OB_00490 [Archangium sp.]